MNEPAKRRAAAETGADRRPLPQVWVSGVLPDSDRDNKLTARRSPGIAVRASHR
jgi:hypothetical protein